MRIMIDLGDVFMNLVGDISMDNTLDSIESNRYGVKPYLGIIICHERAYLTPRLTFSYPDGSLRDDSGETGAKVSRFHQSASVSE
jgi:hypothetical protein